MNGTDPKTGLMGLALLAGLAGAVLFTILTKPRAGYNRRFLNDFPAYAGDISSSLKSRPPSMAS